MRFISPSKTSLPGGYYSDSDYYYFCDCVLRQEQEYYEDLHGNRIIGNYHGLKFVFSGFHSVIEIGENVRFQETVFYIHNDSKIRIGKNAQFQGTAFHVYNASKIEIGNGVRFQDTDFYVDTDSTIVSDDDAQFIESCFRSHPFSEVTFGKSVYVKQNNIIVEDDAKLQVKYECSIMGLCIDIKKCAEVTLGEEISISSSIDRKTHWHIGEYAKFEIGSKGRFNGRAGDCVIGEKCILKIGNGFSINGNYRIILNTNTSMLIGEDCMFSYDISIRGNDGHSIFDIENERNINSCDDISRGRKIEIGNHVWVGERAYILYNTQIGDGSIIGAMSLVKNKIPNNCIAAGIPARVIRRNIAWSRGYGAENIMECGQEYIHYTEDL